MENVFEITQFGAVGDGVTDCTAAIQKALDKAGECKGTVIVPPGKYICSDLKMSRDTSIRGFDSWSFRNSNSSVLILGSDKAQCLLNITGAIGCTVSNLCLEGRNIGDDIHGIMINHPIYDAAKEEDSPTIENCRAANFSGNAVHFNHVWCATVRNNMLCFSKNGFYHDGWDLFMRGNWLSGNRECGYKAGKLSSSVMFTDNRVEWNNENGMDIQQCKFTIISNNQFDRAGKTQLKIHSTGDGYNRNITVTGNSFNRSGSGIQSEWMKDSGYESCQIYAEDCVNLVISSNVMHTGRDGKDANGNRHFGPAYGIIIKHLRNSIIKDNVMQSASTTQNIVDLGGHDDEIIIKDNIGGVMESAERWTAMLSGKPIECVRSYFDLSDEEKKAMGLN